MMCLSVSSAIVIGHWPFWSAHRQDIIIIIIIIISLFRDVSNI